MTYQHKAFQHMWKFGPEERAHFCITPCVWYIGGCMIPPNEIVQSWVMCGFCGPFSLFWMSKIKPPAASAGEKDTR